MNEQDRFDGQYRRPRPHFSDEKADVRPTVDRSQLLTGGAMLLGLALLLIVALAVIPLKSDLCRPTTALNWAIGKLTP